MLKWAGIFIVLLLPAAMPAQNTQAAVGGNSSLWAGAEASSFNPDYSCSSNEPFGCQGQLIGPAAFFDFNVTPKWGAEGEARWLHWHGSGHQIESTYLAGGRYRFARAGRFDGWVKFLAGAGLITTPGYPAAGSLKGSFFAYSPGLTAEFRLSDRLALRGDYEYEMWPSFAGPPTFDLSTGTVITHAHGLSPNGFSVGVTYRFLGQ